jgi:hypothetical protein
MAASKIEYKTVAMDDGRTVDFPGKRKMLKDSIIKPDGTVQVRLDFVNGETRLFTIPDNLLAKFAAHGAEQKLGDEVAGLADIEDGILAIDELMDRLAEGHWGVKREVSALAGASVLVKAMVEATGKTPEVVKAFLATKTNSEKAALKANAKIAPIVARLEAGKKKKEKVEVDTDALLHGLHHTAEEEVLAAAAELPEKAPRKSKKKAVADDEQKEAA